MLCNLCGYEENNSLVRHLAEEHEIGIQEYLNIFPGAKVLSGEIWAMLTNPFLSDKYLAKITGLKPKDQKLFMDNNWDRQRSKISVLS